MDFDLSVPFPTGRGMKPKFFTVPARGEVELDELDNITIERLRWHYDRRPVDAKDKGNEDAPHHEIGLMKIEILDGKAKKPKAA
jgi:hypothetical protein